MQMRMIVICIKKAYFGLENIVHSRSLNILVIAISLMLALTACGSKESTGSMARNGNFVIVTSFYPVYLSTINIAKDISGVEVVNMSEPQTGCLHDYQLAPSDMKNLERADAFVINGAGMEAFMGRIAEQLPELKVIEASKGLELLNNETNGGKNPHVWVSITDAMVQVRNIAAQLAESDPGHSHEYLRNAETYLKKLQIQKDKMHKALDPLKNRDIVTFHEAFPYFAKEFNLNIVAVIEREPGSEPSAGELADIIDVIEKTGVKALFAEPQYSPRAVDSIAKQTGAKVYTLDPVVTGENAADFDAYIKAMDANMESLLEALGGRQT